MNPAKLSRKLFHSCTREVNEKKDLNEFQELLRTGTGVGVGGQQRMVQKFCQALHTRKFPRHIGRTYSNEFRYGFRAKWNLKAAFRKTTETQRLSTKKKSIIQSTTMRVLLAFSRG